MLNSDNDEQGEGNKDMVRDGRRRKRMGHMGGDIVMLVWGA